MADVTIDIEANDEFSEEFQRLERRLEGLENQANQTSGATTRLMRSTEGLRTEIGRAAIAQNSFRVELASSLYILQQYSQVAFGIVRSIVQVTAETEAMRATLRVTERDVNAVSEELLELNRTLLGIEINTVLRSFTQFRVAGAEVGQAQTNIQAVADSISELGKSTAETTRVMLQLTQAYAANAIRGDDFRTIFREIPQFANAASIALGTAVTGVESFRTAIENLGLTAREGIDRTLTELDRLSIGGDPTTFRAQSERFQESLDDIRRALGEQILPILTNAARSFNEFVGAVGSEEIARRLQQVTTIIIALVAAVGVRGLATAIASLIPQVRDFVSFARLGSQGFEDLRRSAFSTRVELDRLLRQGGPDPRLAAISRQARDLQINFENASRQATIFRSVIGSLANIGITGAIAIVTGAILDIHRAYSELNREIQESLNRTERVSRRVATEAQAAAAALQIPNLGERESITEAELTQLRNVTQQYSEIISTLQLRLNAAREEYQGLFGRTAVFGLVNIRASAASINELQGTIAGLERQITSARTVYATLSEQIERYQGNAVIAARASGELNQAVQEANQSVRSLLGDIRTVDSIDALVRLENELAEALDNQTEARFALLRAQNLSDPVRIAYSNAIVQGLQEELRLVRELIDVRARDLRLISAGAEAARAAAQARRQSEEQQEEAEEFRLPTEEPEFFNRLTERTATATRQTNRQIQQEQTNLFDSLLRGVQEFFDFRRQIAERENERNLDFRIPTPEEQDARFDPQIEQEAADSRRRQLEAERQITARGLQQISQLRRRSLNEDLQQEIASVRQSFGLVQQISSTAASTIGDTIQQIVSGQIESFRQVAVAFISQSLRIIAQYIVQTNIQRALNSAIERERLASIQRVTAAELSSIALINAARSTSGIAGAAISPAFLGASTGIATSLIGGAAPAIALTALLRLSSGDERALNVSRILGQRELRQ